MAMPAGKKEILTHPVSGRELKIDKSIYTSFNKAIKQSLKSSKGKPFTKLADDVAKIIRRNMPVPIAIGIKGSIPWYAIYVLSRQIHVFCGSSSPANRC